jgi:nucleoside-diphosphate-sugar epimerase
MIHGPGNKGNLNLLYKFVRLGLPYPLGAYNNERSFLSIDNLNFIIKEILSREDIPEGIYNLADDEPLSTKKIIYTINRVLEKKYMILHIPQCLVKNIARVGDFFKLPFNTIRLNKLTENFVVSNKKIRNVLNGGMPIKAEDGLYMTIESFKSNIN